MKAVSLLVWFIPNSTRGAALHYISNNRVWSSQQLAISGYLRRRFQNVLERESCTERGKVHTVGGKLPPGHGAVTLLRGGGIPKPQKLVRFQVTHWLITVFVTTNWERVLGNARLPLARNGREVTGASYTSPDGS